MVDLLCAICLRNGNTEPKTKQPIPAVTLVNGTALCKDCAIVAPRNALPYAELGR